MKLTNLKLTAFLLSALDPGEHRLTAEAIRSRPELFPKLDHLAEEAVLGSQIVALQVVIDTGATVRWVPDRIPSPIDALTWKVWLNDAVATLTRMNDGRMVWRGADGAGWEQVKALVQTDEFQEHVTVQLIRTSPLRWRERLHA